MFDFFRRYQKKMLAFLAIFAMVAFTLDFSLFRRTGFFGGGGENPVVARLDGRKLRRQDLMEMIYERSRANRFMSAVINNPNAEYFGGLSDREIVDAIILNREADRLGIPKKPELAVRWLQEQTGGQLNSEIFDGIYRRLFSQEVTDEQLLSDIAAQIRLQEVRMLAGFPQVSPLDVYENYKEQYERVSAKSVPFAVASFVDQAPQPTEQDLIAFFEKYKNELPDPERVTPGFKLPQRIRAEYVAGDVPALADQIKTSLTEPDLRAVFTERQSEFPLPPPELPEGLFAGEATLTPKLGEPYQAVREDVANIVSRERAEKLVDQAFETLRDKVFAPLADRYLDAVEARKEASEGGSAVAPALPQFGDELRQAVEALNKNPVAEVKADDDPQLAATLARAGLKLQYEKTPLLERTLAENYGQIGSASGRGATFADLFFDTRRDLFEEIELSDPQGRRFLAWKVEDQAERVPTFDEVRDQVVQAWRFDKARALADKAAKDFAAKVKEGGGDIAKAATEAGRSVITTAPVPRMEPGLFMGMFGNPEPPRPSEIPQIPDAGTALRDKLFGLKVGQVEVAANTPESIYYVMSLNEVAPATFSNLYTESGPRSGVEMGLQTESFLEHQQEWMKSLRASAGLPEDWVPPDEQEKEKRS